MTTIDRPGRRQGAPAPLAADPEVVEHLAVVRAGQPEPAGRPAVDPVVEGYRAVTVLSRPRGALEIRAQPEALIVQMKMTMCASAIPIASDRPLEFQAQPDLSMSAPRRHPSAILTRRHIVWATQRAKC